MVHLEYSQGQVINIANEWEMELIYDLKGHVKQIQQELRDLRQALSTCINMHPAKPQNLMQTRLSDSNIHSGAHIYLRQLYNKLYIYLKA